MEKKRAQLRRQSQGGGAQERGEHDRLRAECERLEADLASRFAGIDDAAFEALDQRRRVLDDESARERDNVENFENRYRLKFEHAIRNLPPTAIKGCVAQLMTLRRPGLGVAMEKVAEQRVGVRAHTRTRTFSVVQRCRRQRGYIASSAQRRQTGSAHHIHSTQQNSTTCTGRENGAGVCVRALPASQMHMCTVC
ncbi:unnamed protein product [Sphagnum balticum]